jgi:hypothetical protein
MKPGVVLPRVMAVSVSVVAALPARGPAAAPDLESEQASEPELA